MQYFNEEKMLASNKEKMLAFNEEDRFALDESDLELRVFSSIDDVISVLETYKDKLSELDSEVDNTWANDRFLRKSDCACGALYLKQIILFIRRESPDVSGFINQLKVFSKLHTKDYGDQVVIHMNAYKLWEFTYDGRQVVDLDESARILRQFLNFSRNLKGGGFFDLVFTLLFKDIGKKFFSDVAGVNDVIKKQIISEETDPYAIGWLADFFLRIRV